MRILRRSPGFSVAAVFTLAAGIAAVVTMFAVYWAVVLSPIRLPDPGAVVSIARVQKDPTVPTTLSWPRVQAMRAAAPAFDAMGAFSNETVTLGEAGAAPRELRAVRVSAGFFETLRLAALRGRLFTAADDVPNGAAVCLLSAELWRSAFGGGDVIGRVVPLSGRPTQIVGVLPPRLTAPWGDREIFLPRVFDDFELTPQLVAAGASYLNVVARLAPGKTLAQANEQLRSVTRDFVASFPGRSDTLSEVQATPLADFVVANRRSTLTLLLGAVVVVLLVSCANAAALMLSRLTSRQRELAVRQALGATRLVLVRDVVAETLTLSIVAGAVGVMTAQVGVNAIAAALGALLPPGARFTVLDGPVLLMSIATVACAASIVGLVPALHATRTSSDHGVAASARGLSATVRTRRVRSALVVAEVALSAFLLVGAGLFITSLQRALATPVGFDPSATAAAEIALPPQQFPGADRQRALFVDVLERARALPRVSSAAIAFGLPFANDNFVSPYVIGGRVVPPPAGRRRAGLRIVTEDYLAVTRTRLLAGRFFTSADRDGTHPVCVINRSLARREFGDQSPLGAVVLRGREADQPFEIVGLVDDVRTNGPNNVAPDELFLPFRQVPRSSAWIVVRTDGDPAAMAPLLQGAVAAAHPELAASGFTTMEDALAATLGPERILAGLAGAFAVAAMVLAAVGLYAVLAHAVAARTVEIGIRMAIGAGRPAILRLILSGALRLVAVGIAIGLAAALAASRIVSAQLHGVSARDPAIYATVAVVFAGVGVLAALVPARRATRVDPLVSLTAS